jgi:hypothetical protein
MLTISRIKGSAMYLLHNDVQDNLPKAEVADGALLVSRVMRTLSQQEIKAVAGGPEGSVGSGMSPPN